MLNQRRKLSVLRNSERRSRSAKRSFKHGASRVSGAKQFPHTDLIFWFVFYQEKMNKRNPSKVKFSPCKLKQETKIHHRSGRNSISNMD